MSYTDINSEEPFNPDDYNVEEDEDGNLELNEPEDDEADGELDASGVEDDFTMLEEGNLAETLLTDDQLDELLENVIEGIGEDLESLSTHFDTLKKGTALLGIKLEEAGNLGDWSCGATHPLIAENGIKFQASVVNELDLPDNLVKTRIIGNTGNEKLEASAQRKQDFMNYYLTTEIDDEFYPESARCALNTAFFGTGFKFNYWDETTKRICTEFLRTDQVILNFSTKALSKAPRFTVLRESSELDIINKMQSGLFRKINLTAVDSSNTSELERKGGELEPLTKELYDVVGVEYSCERLLAYTYIYLDAKSLLKGEDGEAPEGEREEEEDEDAEYGPTGSSYYDRSYLPFLVITELYSNQILGVYANWMDNGKGNKYAPREYVTDYHFIPGFGFYSLGYVHVLGNFAKMLTAIMRSLVDAGTFANLQGGFKLRGTKINGKKKVSPGEFIDVETTAQDITKAIMTLPFKEPSAVLNAMYAQLEQRGQMFANATEGVVQGATNYGPVGTTMALIESSSKLSTAIIRGFHRSRRREYGVISRILMENLDSYPYEIDGVPREAFKEDFNPAIPLYPVSDPNIPTQSQRLAIAQQYLQIAQQLPQVHDLREALKRVYRAMGDQNPDKLLPAPQQAQPLSPMEDVLAAGNNMPIKAFPGQDHQAHIAFKQAYVQNPSVANNELMATTVNALLSNIREHMMLDIQEKVQAMTTGAATDPNSMAQVQAMAMQRITQTEQMAVQAQQQAGDPAFLMAKAALEKNQIDMQRQQSQEVRDAAKLTLEKEKLELDKAKLANQNALEENRLKMDLLKTKTKSKEDRTNKALDMLMKAAQEDQKAQLDLTKEEMKQATARTKATSKEKPSTPKKPVK